MQYLSKCDKELSVFKNKMIDGFSNWTIRVKIAVISAQI